jgi:pimeloyl-ACP methyl ester carboxylesterase
MLTYTQTLTIHEIGVQHTPTLIFLHGGGGAGWMWQSQLEVGGQQYHCLVPDLPEHGASRPIAPFTILSAAEAVAEVIRTRAKDGKAHVIGLSLGAQVATQLLALAPECIQSAIISSPLLRPIAGANWYTPALLRWVFWLTVAPFQNSAWYARLNMQQAAGMPASYFPQFYAEFRQMSAANFANIMHANFQFRLPVGVEHCSAPVLVVVGKRELPTMHASARDLLAALPNAQGVQVAVGRNAAENHNWNMTAPTLFNGMLQAWLTQQPLPNEFVALKG